MKTETQLNADREWLLDRLAEVELDLKLQSSWAVVSMAYGMSSLEDYCEIFESYKAACAAIYQHNSQIDKELDKAYRKVLAIVPWKSHVTGKLIHPESLYLGEGIYRIQETPGW